VRTFNSDRLCQNATFWKHREVSERCKGNNPGQLKSGPGEKEERKDYYESDESEEELEFSCTFGAEIICKDNSEVVCEESSEACFTRQTKLCDNNETCIHHTLECDGYIQCPDGSDEEETKCKACPRDFGYPEDKLKIATFSCRHRYTGNWICAVPCDGHDDLCQDFEDEKCDLGTSLSFIAAVGEAFVFHQKNIQSDSNEENKNLKLVKKKSSTDNLGQHFCEVNPFSLA
jgi:hypothetical protein